MRLRFVCACTLSGDAQQQEETQLLAAHIYTYYIFRESSVGLQSSVNTHFAYHSAAFPFHMSGEGFIFAFSPAAGSRVCSVARTLLHPFAEYIFAAHGG
jgi:hypothetical protein